LILFNILSSSGFSSSWLFGLATFFQWHKCRLVLWFYRKVGHPIFEKKSHGKKMAAQQQNEG
jgi:hypothetical protein